MNKFFLLLLILNVALLVTACQKMDGAHGATATAPPTPKKELPPAISEKNDEDFSTENVFSILDAGHSVSIFVLAYADPSNTDLALIRDVVHKADAQYPLDHDLGREREFTDYPFTVDSYLITVRDHRQFQNILDCSRRYPNVKMTVFPVFKMKLKSYLRIEYTKPLFGDAARKMIWIGDSEVIKFYENPSPNLEDPTTYLTYMADCEEFGSACFGSLYNNGYFQHRVIVDNKSVSPLQFLDTELAASLDLLKSGFTGDPSSAKSILNLNFNKTVIRNITLVSELWANGPMPTSTTPSDPLFRVEDAQKHPMVAEAKDAGPVFYMVPVSVNESDIPMRIRATPSKVIGLLEKMRVQINSFAE